jgi:hypothetical protein
MLELHIIFHCYGTGRRMTRGTMEKDGKGICVKKVNG